VQHDSGICYPEAWEDSFLDYDVLGAAWLYTDGRNVSNGGFSLRSKKLQTILGTDPHIEITSPEDEIIGRLYRGYLEEKHGIKFPTDEVADRFSFELREPRCKTFGKHGDFHQQYRPTVIIKRTAAAGDCLLLEPVARYYAAKGWNVVLDIPIEFFALFSNHYFPIKHIGNFDRGRITPEKEINLDLSYESKPRQNYLKSYFEFCGITDYKLTKPQLYPLVGKETRLFEKYFVLHLDRRLTEERNPIDINWKQVKRHIENLGFTVIQVGSNDSEEVGLRVNTKNNIGLLKFIVGGASAFIGVDSLPSHIAVAYNIPSVLLFGSTNPHYIHSDLDNVEVIQGKCSTPNCWHKEGGTAGQICAFKDTPNYLQCCKHSADDIIDAINKFVKQ
jgi:ADP-heptose:LPS heptosyltransferase